MINIKKIALSACLVMSMALMSNSYTTKYAQFLNLESCTSSYMIKPLHLDYVNLNPKPDFENLSLLCIEGKYGINDCDSHTRMLAIFMRALRFQNITKAVEEKYELPENLLLTMLMQECHGINYLPNGQNDGGIGLIHMQPLLANQFGLNTLNGCKDLVCHHHGRQLKGLIGEFSANPEELIRFDDRFHPVVNIDAAGRMIKYYSTLNMIGKDKWDSAFKRYAGKYNYAEYTKNLRFFKAHLEDTFFMSEVELIFNEINQNLVHNGNKADYKEYIRINSEYHYNFELDRYINTTFEMKQ